MAIKTSNAGPHAPTNFPGMPRGSYRSNVKSRKLNQNGLEAQYQGIDIREVNIDHAGLAILGRAGGQYGGFRNIVKTKRQYKVLAPDQISYPELTFELTPNFASNGTLRTNYVTSVTKVRLRSTNGTENIYQFSFLDSGTTLTNGNTAVFLADSSQEPLGHLQALKAQILSDFGPNVFKITVFSYRDENNVQKSRMKLISNFSSEVGQLLFECTPATVVELWSSPNNSHQWTLHGYAIQEPIKHAFYEDVRSDMIKGADFSRVGMGPWAYPYKWISESDGTESIEFASSISTAVGRNIQSSKGVVVTLGQPIVNLEGHLSGVFGTLPAGITASSLSVGSTIDSDEIKIEQIPKRQTVFNTYEDNLQWREDLHYLNAGEQQWDIMLDKAALFVEPSDVVEYGSVEEQHIANMMDSNFADDQYITKEPLSGRVDMLQRLSKHYDLHLGVMTERHQYSILDQYLDQTMDFVNVLRNSVPLRDVTEGQLAFEDNKGWGDDTVGFLHNDYFNQRYIEAHDYVESERYTRIDAGILAVVTPEYRDSNNKLRRIQRREWQEPNYIYTATGFITSQVVGNEGIMYKDLKR